MASLSEFFGSDIIAQTGQDIKYWVGTGAQYDALATTASPPGPGYDTTTVYYVTDR